MPYFFFSYSRADAVDSYLYRFFDELNREMALRSGIPEADAGFLDRDQQPGVEWATNTSAAVNTCNVFVPVYSPNYFTSSYCGQEWHAFNARVSAHRDTTGETLACVVPVWWVPLDREPPPSAARLQDTRDLFGDDHRDYGARFLLRLKENNEHYSRYLVQFTNLVLAAGENPPAAGQVVDLASMPNAFDAERQAPAPRHGPRTAISTKKKVTFVVVATGHDRMCTIRQASLDVYGEDGDEWRPYHPGCSDPVALRAQGVAVAQELLSNTQHAGQDLFELLAAAEDRRELVILIIDPWVSALPDYGQLLTRLNGKRYGTTAIIVPSDENVPGGAIRDKLRVLLENWTDNDDHTFRDGIPSMSEFENNLAQMLVAIRGRILKKATVARRVLATGPMSPPLLTGPGS